MLSEYFGYGIIDILIASIPDILINIVVMGIIAAVGAIIGAAIFRQRTRDKK